MGRWAYGDEVVCGNGGCRNVAEWVLKHRGTWPRPWPVCALHRPSAEQMLRKRYQVYQFEAEPLHDAGEPARRKRRQQGDGRGLSG